MLRQFTATAYILDQDKVLLHYHGKLGKWLPPGGHIEENETPPECAKRETLEETGLIIDLIQDEHLTIERWNATSFQRPFMCLLENIPPHKDQPAHQHMDFIYLARPIGGEITPAHQQLHEIRWFTQEEILALQDDVEIFVETKTTIEKIYEISKTLSIPSLRPSNGGSIS